MAESEYVRLHITPFTSGLINTILPASILPNARNISYHTIETFPEKSYGYVELPTMDAERIKKKLNGTTLKGAKVKIDRARPEKERTIIEGPGEVERPKKEKKKRKRGELPGVDIGARQVKRGWTVPGKDAGKKQVEDEKMVVKSKYTTGPECLFKTHLPPNVASKGKNTKLKVEKGGETKPGRGTVVHEFANSTKYATFLRGSHVSSQTKVVAAFVEGKGWIDDQGNLIEEVTKKSRKSKASEPRVVEKKDSSSESEDQGAVAESSLEDERMDGSTELPTPAVTNIIAGEAGSSSDEASSDEESDQMNVGLDVAEPSPKQAAEEISINDSSSSLEAAETDQNETLTPWRKANITTDSSSEGNTGSGHSNYPDNESEVEESKSAISNRSHTSNGPALSIHIPSLTSTPVATAVHPLEALYKREKADDASISSKAAVPSFSFGFGFGATDEDVDEDEDGDAHTETQLQAPSTPFTQRDFEWRGMRSAAPTPDTAHPNKRFFWPSEEEDGDKHDEALPSSPTRKDKTASAKDGEERKEPAPESDFQNWFWENRGNVDRAWKKRRKTVAKEKRQRENRKGRAV